MIICKYNMYTNIDNKLGKWYICLVNMYVKCRHLHVQPQYVNNSAKGSKININAMCSV